MKEDPVFEETNKELFNQLSKGSEVEVLYGKEWFLSKVLQVNQEKSQIFIHYKGWNSRHDHWVLVGDGVRLPGVDASAPSTPSKTSSSSNNTLSSVVDVANSPIQKGEAYQPGTMLLGEWKDGYKYVCFVQSTSANGAAVNVKFYDGSRVSLHWSKLSPVTDLAIKEYEQWKYEESQIKDYEKRTGKRVKSFEQLVKVLALNNSSTPTKDPLSSSQNVELKNQSIIRDIIKEPTTCLLDTTDTISSSCPESGKFQCEQPDCGKSFRKLTLLLHHTKHYHKNSDLVDEQVSKSCSADVLAKQLKERRSLATGHVREQKRKHSPHVEIHSSPDAAATGRKKSKISSSSSLPSSPLNSKKSVTSKMSGTSDKLLPSAPKTAAVTQSEAATDEEVDVFVVEGQAPHSPELKGVSKIVETQSLVTDEQVVASDISMYETEINKKTPEPASPSLHELLRFASKQKNQKKTPKLKLTGGSKYYCKLCGGSFASGKSYHKHMAIHGGVPLSDAGSASEEMPKKDAETSESVLPKKTKQTKTPASNLETNFGKDFTCPVCSQKFLTEESLEVHQKVRLHFVDEKTDEPVALEESSAVEVTDSNVALESAHVDLNEKSPKEVVLDELKFKSPIKSRHSQKKDSRRLKLLNSLKKPKLPKFGDDVPKIKVHCDFGAKESEKKKQNVLLPAVAPASKAPPMGPKVDTEPAFVPVFLDPPSADEVTETQTPDVSTSMNGSGSQKAPLVTDGSDAKIHSGKIYEKAQAVVCPHNGCGKSFRKQSFLDLHEKHYHSSEKVEPNKETSNKATTSNVITLPTKPTSKKITVATSKTKTKPSVSKKAATEPRRNVSKIPTSASDTWKPISPKIVEESPVVEPPVKETYNDILNDSLTAKAETSPLSSDNEENFAEKLTVKSVHDSPSQQGLKKVFKLKFTSLLSENQTGNPESQNGDSPKKSSKFKRAVIDDSEVESEASVDSEGWSGETIKCVCDLVEVFGTMVQCSFCNVWLHAECLEVNENALPEEYECPYCEVRRRVRDTEVRSDWFTQSCPQDPLGSGIPTEPLVQKTAPWIAATDQLSDDLDNLQTMIETFEELYEVMQNPGHVNYPQLVLRFQNDLQTFDSHNSKLEYSDLDPNVVKLIMELEESSSRLIQPEEDSPVESSFKNETSDPIDDATNLDSSLEIDEGRDCSENNEKRPDPIITWLSPEKMDLESLDNIGSLNGISCGNADDESSTKDTQNTDRSELSTDASKSELTSNESNIANDSDVKHSSESSSLESEQSKGSNEPNANKPAKTGRKVTIDFDPSVPPKNILEMMNRLLFQLETRMDHLENLFEKVESGYYNSIESFPSERSHYKFYNGEIMSEEELSYEMRRLSNDLFLITQLSKFTA